MPLISIIVPVYNVEAYLEKCINSIICQSYKNLEIILVNDGSTDNSPQICNDYKIKDNRIKVIHKENGGLSDARNQGLKVATGEYIAFLDSDDWVDKELYRTLYNLIVQYEADVSVCNFKKVLSEEEQLNKSKKEYVYGNIEVLNKLYTEERTQMVLAWNKLYKREILLNMEFPKGKIHEDVFLIPKILYKANKIVYTEKELIYYRSTPNSITNKKFNIKRLDYLDAISSISDFYKEKKLYNLYIKSIIHEIESILSFAVDIQVLDKYEKYNIIKAFISKINEKKHIVNEYIDIKMQIKIIIFNLSPQLYVNTHIYKNKIKNITRNTV